jgi:hypothetical protein
MDRPRSHEIDDQAIAIFRSIKPVELVISDLHPDYAKDYFVEIADGNKMTGEQAIVQLKGQQALRALKGSNSFSFMLKQKHAVYFADKEKLPVFLVLIDVNKKEGYWLFVQQYLLETLRGRKWRHKRSIAVHVPACNSLANKASFLEAIRSARTYMAAHQPAAINAAITAKKLSIESLDPRFTANVVANESGERYMFNAKEPVDISLIFKGPPDEVRKRIDDLIDRGLPIEIAPGEFSDTGSPLFDEMFKQGGIFECNRKLQATTVLMARDASGNVIARLDQLRAIVQGGPLEARIESELPNAPFVLSNTWTHDIRRTNLSFNIDLDRWQGQRIQLLAYFDQLHSFITAMQACTDVRFELYFLGNFALGGIFTPKRQICLERFAVYLDVLARARVIARKFGLNPALPLEITHSEVREIDLMYKFLTTGEARRPFGKQDLTIEIREPYWDVVEETMNNADEAIPFAFGHNEMKAHLFGQEYGLGEIDIELTRVVFSSEEKENVRMRLATDKTGSIVVRCASAPDCEWIIRRTNSESYTTHERPLL